MHNCSGIVKMPNNCLHSDKIKLRSFLTTLYFVGEAWRYVEMVTIRLRYLLIVLVLVALVSCESNRFDNQILHRDTHLTESMYEILGMLSEYISRFDYGTGEPIPDLIEYFYPHETNHADRLESLLKSHADMTGLRQDWRKEIGRQGHIYFYSSQWSRIINSFYIKVDRTTATLDPTVFQQASQSEMLRFIQGVYVRYGNNDKRSAIRMANAPYKIETIASVLKKLGCSDIVIFVLEYIPHSYQVHFNPSPIVIERLNIEQVALKPDMSDIKDWRVHKRIN